MGRGWPTPVGGGASTLLIFFLALTPGLVSAQQALPDQGVVAAGLLLRQLDGVKRVLVVGAHPDDEDTSLLATLARGMGARAAYLALTRGEGGQNLIGSELGQGLGLVRTGELLAARELDGAEQFFTRAFDFGYSKNAEESLDHWPKEEVLRDVVWVVRSFRPQVIVTIFTGTPRDGHGQHQVAGMMARAAFDVAGDPARFPEQLQQGVRPWKPLKLYQRRFGRSYFGDQEVPEGATVAVETGRYDPLLGQSWFQLAMASRSQHRSQDMGAPQLPGPRVSGFELVKSRVGPVSDAMEEGFFQGVDTALVSLAERLPEDARPVLADALTSYRARLDRARASLNALDPAPAVPALAGMVQALEKAREVAEPHADPEVLAVLARRLELTTRALLAAAAVSVDVRVEDDLLVPGQDVRVDVNLWNGGRYDVEEAEAYLKLPPGWKIGKAEPAQEEGPTTVRPGSLSRWSFLVSVPPDAPVSQPYFLREPMDGDLYRWPNDPSLWAIPRTPPLLKAGVEFSVGAEDLVPTRVEVERAGEHVRVRPDRGELRTSVLVVPAASLSLEPRAMAWPLERDRERTVGVVARGHHPEGVEGTLTVEPPPGWSAEPREAAIRLPAPGAEETAEFRIRPGPEVGAGRPTFRVALSGEGGEELSRGFDLVDYEHIDRWALFRPAELEVSVFPVRVARDLRVGYVMGSGDAGFEAIRQLGVQAELLGPDQIQGGDLGRFDVLVLGVRAYETRPDLVAANPRVLQFAREGGTVVVQYNKYEFDRGDFAPYPVEIHRPHDRVTNPEAPVTFLDPDNPVFTSPNRIGPEDFQGWVQERGLYFLGEWDSRYTPLLAIADPGEEPKEGSLVVSPVGDGIWVYTGLSFFRQFPAGVPGAYRLFANLLSLNGEKWRAAMASLRGGG